MADFGKEKCEYLRNIRVKIAAENGIHYEPAECNHEGNCPGFCPVCDREIEYITQQLEYKESKGESVKLDGLCIDDLKMANYATVMSDEEGGIDYFEDIDDDSLSVHFEPKNAGDYEGSIEIPEEMMRESFDKDK